MARVTSNYDYITKSQRCIIESSLPIQVIQDNLLDFQIAFESFDWARDEMDRIAVELVSMGKYFAEEQGLYETHNLIDHIKAEVTNNYGVKFYNDARNTRGQFYAGHHEYGYRGRDGKFIEARPFMRPALYAVSRASHGEFATILEELLRNVFSTSGYKGVSNLTFGKELGHFHQGISSPNRTLSRMKKESTIKLNYFGVQSEKKTRNQYSVKRSVFSDKRNEMHKKDLGWRSVKGSVRSGRNINKSRLASVSYAKAHLPERAKTKYLREENFKVSRSGYARKTFGESPRYIDSSGKEHRSYRAAEYASYLHDKTVDVKRVPSKTIKKTVPQDKEVNVKVGVKSKKPIGKIRFKYKE